MGQYIYMGEEDQERVQERGGGGGVQKHLV
jgi:hypothetical protein